MLVQKKLRASPRVHLVYVAWRKAMRRVWQLSNVTHCLLLPIICNCLPIDITLEKKFLKFIWNCFNNSNTIVQIIVNISMKNRKSVLGINFRYLAFKYKIKSNYWQEDWKHIERCIFNYAETTRSDSDYYVGNTVRELYLTRSADFILDTAELNLLIHHLCTSYSYYTV